MSSRILYGDGDRSHPWVVKDVNGERIETTTLKEITDACDRAGITKLKFPLSGRYLESREDGWWETSDSEQCDKVHGLLPEGRLRIKK
jgi:hypothetical protein